MTCQSMSRRTQIFKRDLGEGSLVEVVSDEYGAEIDIIVHARGSVDFQCAHQSIGVYQLLASEGQEGKRTNIED